MTNEINGVNGSAELTVGDVLVLDGRKVQGVRMTSRDGEYLVEADALKGFLEAEKDYNMLKLGEEALSKLCKSYRSTFKEDDRTKFSMLVDLFDDISMSIADESVHQKIDELISAFRSSPSADSEEVDKLRQQLAETKEKLRLAEQKDLRLLGRELSRRSAEVRSGKRVRAQALMLSLSIRGKTTAEIADALAERGYGNTNTTILKALSARQPEDKERLRGIMQACPDEFDGITEDDFRHWFDERCRKAAKACKKRELKRRLENEIDGFGEVD